jgi:hypothetical protein
MFVQGSWFRKGVSARKFVSLFVVLCLVIGAAFFTGCDTNGDGLLPGLPTGTWVSSYGEEFSITSSEFISSYGGSVGYKGDIVNVREDGLGAGYITIKYTENAWNTPAVGNYYVIHWRYRMKNSVDLSGCSDPMGKANRTDAETEYTIDNVDANGKGYFEIYSTCAIQNP